MLMFLAIALLSIWLIFTPATIHQKVGNQETILAPSALTAGGMLLRVETWKEYPDYTIGLGVISGIGFIGTFLVLGGMLNEMDQASNL